MIRNLRVLGLALVAVLAMSAMAASAARAHTPAEFTSSNASATITANQIAEHRFTVTGQQLTCKIANFEGTPNATTSTSVKLAATYDECTFAGFSATVTGFATDHSEIGQAGKCWYRFYATGAGGLECNNAEMTVDAATCVIHVPAQNFASGLTFTNVPGSNPHDVWAKFVFQNVTAIHTDGFLCPLTSSGHNATAVLEGESTMVAEVGAIQTSLTWDATEP